MVSVSSRAHRTLKNLKTFREYDSSEAIFEEILFDAGEIIGIYENPSKNENESLVITGKGIFFKIDGEWGEILFKEILEVSSPQDKSNACTLSLKMKGGVTRILPVKGGGDKFRDVYSFHRFILGVLSDHEKN